MACRYYDDIIVKKLQKWIPEASKLRVLKPDETKRLFELTANDNADQAFKLPFIALSRNNDIELLSTVKQPKSYDGLKLIRGSAKTLQLNVIPIKLQYNLDIYTKKYEEGDEYVRNFLFKLINNPLLIIDIPYSSSDYDDVTDTKTGKTEAILRHTANIRVLSTISDTSSISERIFSGQFTRWTIQFEIQDAFLFSIPYKTNWQLYTDEDLKSTAASNLELSSNINTEGELEKLDFNFRK